MSEEWDKRVIINENEICNWFVSNHYDNKSYLYILGMGFDKRMCDGVEEFLNTRLPFTLWKISYDEGPLSPSRAYQNQIDFNKNHLNSIIAGIKTVEKNIAFWQNDGRNNRYIAEISAGKLIKNSEFELHNYSDIIIDISALPQTLYLCMLNMLLNCCEKGQRIYIIVNENYAIDKKTKPVEIDEFAHEMQGFSTTTEDIDSVQIWYPVLGETNPVVLKRHFDFITGTKHVDEICPVVPFPAADAKRADDIIRGYRKELFSDWKIDKKNIIYASETSPIRVCESLYSTSLRYKEVLKPLGECSFVFSAITSKLMSIGVFLAVFDLKRNGTNVSLLNVNNKGYTVNNEISSDKKSVLTCVMLSNA